MKAGPAVVAQIGHEMQIGLRKSQPARHGWEHGAKAFAVAACIANLQLACGFAFGLGGGPLAIGQVFGFLGELLQRAHGATPDKAACAACVPAMRPKAVPIDMPTPAV